MQHLTTNFAMKLDAVALREKISVFHIVRWENDRALFTLHVYCTCRSENGCTSGENAEHYLDFRAASRRLDHAARFNGVCGSDT